MSLLVSMLVCDTRSLLLPERDRQTFPQLGRSRRRFSGNEYSCISRLTIRQTDLLRRWNVFSHGRDARSVLPGEGRSDVSSGQRGLSICFRKNRVSKKNMSVNPSLVYFMLWNSQILPRVSSAHASQYPIIFLYSSFECYFKALQQVSNVLSM